MTLPEPRPSRPTADAPLGTRTRRLVELSHVITSGMTTYPGLPAPEIAPHRVVDLPTVVVRTVDEPGRGVGVAALAGLDVTGAAALLHTGGDAAWGTDAYAVDAPFLTADGAQWLVEHGAALVGIDSVNIDEVTAHGERPAHTLLLAAGIPIVEHLTGLGQLPLSGARFTAAPPRVAGFGTFPVRAFAIVDS